MKMKEYNNKRKEKDHEGKYIRDVQNKNREFVQLNEILFLHSGIYLLLISKLNRDVSKNFLGT